MKRYPKFSKYDNADNKSPQGSSVELVSGGSSVVDRVPQTAASSSDSADWRALLDDLKGDDGSQLVTICSPEAFSRLECARLGANVPCALTSNGVSNPVRDYQQGGRSVQRLINLMHQVASGAAVPFVFFATDVSAGGTEFAAGAWSYDAEFLTFGMSFIATRAVLDVQETQISISNDPQVPFSTGSAPLPGLDFERLVPLIRGAGGQSLMFEAQPATFGITLPWFYRAAVSMDTAQATVSRGQLLTPADYTAGGNYDYISAMSPAPDGVRPIYATVYRVTSTSALSRVRVLPLTNNNRGSLSAGRPMLAP